MLFKNITMKKLNVVIMTITFERFDKHENNSNFNKTIPYFIENTILQQLYSVAMNTILKISDYISEIRR